MLKRFVFLAALVLPVALATAVVLAQGGDDADQKEVSGLVKEVSPTGEMRVLLPSGEEAIVLATSDTAVRIGDRPAGLAEVSPGDRVVVRVDKESSVSREVRVRAKATAEGTLLAADAANGRLVLALPIGATLDLKLAGDSTVEVNGRPASANDLRPGIAARIAYDAISKEAWEVKARAVESVQGRIKSIDPMAGTVMLVGENGREVMVKVTSDTHLDAQALFWALLKLNPSLDLQVQIDMGTRAALEITPH